MNDAAFRTRGRIAVALALGAGLLLCVAPAAGPADGVGPNDSYNPGVSANGRLVSFHSYAEDLVAGDTNLQPDVFVHDRKLGTTSLEDLNDAGAEGVTGASPVALSANGRIVAFASASENLVDADTNAESDIFVRDLKTGSTTRVSVASEGTQADGASVNPSCSASGRFIAFSSDAENLVPDDTGAHPDIFVHDRKTGATTRVSVADDGSEANGSSSGETSLSSSGRFVAFLSGATNLVPGDTNGKFDAFVRDRSHHHTVRASVSSAGEQATGDSIFAALSANGRYVAIDSDAANLVAGDANGVRDIFRHDRKTGLTLRLSLGLNGADTDGQSFGPAISANGRFVAFRSAASNLVPGDSNGVDDIFRVDTKTGDLARVSDPNGGQSDEDALECVLSPSGKLVAFSSRATNIVPGDSNDAPDIFVHDLVTGAIERVSVDSQGGQAGP